MRLEDLHDLELRGMREKVSGLTLQNKNLNSKNNNQKDQSKSADNCGHNFAFINNSKSVSTWFLVACKSRFISLDMKP